MTAHLSKGCARARRGCFAQVRTQLVAARAAESFGEAATELAEPDEGEDRHLFGGQSEFAEWPSTVTPFCASRASTQSFEKSPRATAAT